VFVGISVGWGVLVRVGVIGTAVGVSVGKEAETVLVGNTAVSVTTIAVFVGSTAVSVGNTRVGTAVTVSPSALHAANNRQNNKMKMDFMAISSGEL
jgi:hypothetical protein